MNKIRRRKPKKPTKRMEVSAQREVLRDDRIWCKVGIVVKRGASHFELTDDDLLIEVDLMPEEVEVTCRMGAVGGGAAAGYWFIPPVGSEVAVLIPDGEEADDLVIVGVLSTGELPADVAEGRVVVAGGEVYIHDGAGGAVALALKSDVDAVKSTFDGHRHHQFGYPGGIQDAGTVFGTSVPKTTITTPAPGAGPTDVIAEPAGTIVLKGK